jgi:hypothetical protein
MLRTIAIEIGAGQRPTPVIIDLDETPSICLGNSLPGRPIYGDRWLYFWAEHRVFFTSYLPFIRLDDEQVRWPSGGVGRVTPQRAEIHRVYRVISDEEAQEWARLHGKSLPARGAPKRPGIPNESPTIPERLRAAAEEYQIEHPKARNIPQYLSLVAGYWESAEQPAQEVEIPLGEIIKYCHKNESRVQMKTIQKDTIKPTLDIIHKRSIPLSVDLIKTGAIVKWIPEKDGGPSKAQSEM